MSGEDTKTKDRISHLIWKTGDKGWNQVKNSLPGLVSVLEKDYVQEKNLILDCICVSAVELPFKSSTYATLCSLLNTKNFDIGVDIALVVAKHLQQALDQNDYRNVKNLTRFIVNLTNAKLFSVSSMVNLLGQFLTAIESASCQSERAQTFSYIVLASLIYVDTAVVPETEYLKIVSRLEESKEKWQETSISSMMKIWPNRASESKTSYLWQVVSRRNLQEGTLIPRPYAWFGSVLEEAVQHELIVINVPDDELNVLYPYQGEQIFIFQDEDDTHQLPPIYNTDRFVLTDFISDIIALFPHNHKAGSAYLLALPDFVEFRRYDEKEYNIYESIVEVILLSIIQLPKTAEKPVYYATLLFDVFIAATSKTPAAVGKCLRWVYKHMDMDEGNMDVGAVKRFGEWFSHHLSNFGYVWKWSEWESVVQEDPFSTKYIFVRETLERTIRLAYYDRIKSSITETYVDGKIFPAEAPNVNFLFAKGQKGVDMDLQDYATQLLLIMKSRGTEKEIIEQVDRIKAHVITHSAAMSDMGNDHEKIAHEVLIQCLMMTGSKSFSHLLNAIERNMNLFQQFTDTQMQMEQTIQSVATFWKYNTQFLEIVLDKLMSYQILDPQLVMSWAIHELANQPSRWYLWNIIQRMLTKSILRVQQAKKEKNSSMDLDDQRDSSSYDEAMRDQKNIFIHTFKVLTEILEAKLSAEGEDVVNGPWWKWTSGCMIEIGRLFNNEIKSMKITIETIAFNPRTSSHVMNIWNDLKQIYDKRMI